MKNKSLILLSTLLLTTVGCFNNNSTEKNYTSHGPIEYTDTLPSNVKDGNILHAFNWRFKDIQDNLEAIANAGFKTIQTSPVQQPKKGGTAWWALYQPVSFSIATSSPLGSKDDLKSLCEEAEKYDISIICDIVFNHMATTGNEDSNGLPEVDPEVKEYDYEALMGEFQSMAGKLMQKNSTTNGPKITRIVDKYFGKGKKVSDATIEQAELIYLVVEEIKEEFKSQLV